MQRTTKQTLPLMQAQQDIFGGYEIIVVDYGCPDGTADWCQSLRDKRVKCARVLSNTEEFNRSGALVAKGKILAFVDADICLNPCWLSITSQSILDNQAGQVRVCGLLTKPELFGTCAVHRNIFDQVHGYDENIMGWGAEDDDFYFRCCQISTEEYFSDSLLDPIEHDEFERVKFHRVKSKQESAFAVKRYLRRRGTQLLDLAYQTGDVEVLCCNS